MEVGRCRQDTKRSKGWSQEELGLNLSAVGATDSQMRGMMGLAL